MFQGRPVDPAPSELRGDRIRGDVASRGESDVRGKVGETGRLACSNFCRCCSDRGDGLTCGVSRHQRETTISHRRVNSMSTPGKCLDQHSNTDCATRRLVGGLGCGKKNERSVATAAVPQCSLPKSKVKHEPCVVLKFLLETLSRPECPLQYHGISGSLQSRLQVGKCNRARKTTPRGATPHDDTGSRMNVVRGTARVEAACTKKNR